MRRTLLVVGVVVGLTSPAWALCDGVTDDTLAIQAAVRARTPLPEGTCVISNTIEAWNDGSLIGAPGLRTHLQPTLAMIGYTGIWVHATNTRVDRPVVRDIVLNPLPAGGVGAVGLYLSGDEPEGVDLFTIEHVRVENSGHWFPHAFACYRVDSTRIRDTQFWNYLPQTAAMGFYLCSDWDLFGNEAHTPAPGGNGIASFGSSTLRFWGGNIGLGAGGSAVLGPGVTLNGTTVYVE